MANDLPGFRRRKAPTSMQPEEVNAPSPLRRWLAGGIRVGGGVLSSGGGAPGAGIGAGSEWLAQAAEEAGTREGFTPDWKRVGIEAGISAVPFGKVVKGGGRLLRDMAVSGAMTGAGEALRQGYSGEDSGWLPDTSRMDKGSIGLATLLGVAGGGIGSKLKTAAEARKPATQDFVVETTAQPGGRVLDPKDKLEQITPNRVITVDAPPTPAGPVGPRQRVSREVPYRMGSIPEQGRFDWNAPLEVAETGRVPYGITAPEPYRTAAKAAQKAEDAVEANRIKLEEAERMKAGLQPQEPTVTESVEGVTETGKKVRGTQRYAAEEPEAIEQLDEFLQTGRVVRGGQRWKGVRTEDVPKEGTSLEIFKAWLDKGKSPKQALKLAAKGRPPVGSGIDTPGTRTVTRGLVPEVPAETVPEAAAETIAPETGSALARFFRSPLEAAGEGYGAIKAAKAAGEQVPEEGRRVAGQAAQRLRKEAGLPAPAQTAASSALGTVAPPTRGVTGSPEQQLAETASLIEKLKALGVKGGQEIGESIDLIEQAKRRNRGGGFSSAGFLGISPDVLQAIQRNPELAAQLLSGGVGAGVGALSSEDPLTGAAVGFGAGFAAPKVIPAALKAIGAPVDAVRNMEFRLGSPEEIKQTAQQIFKTLPQLQRFNLLASPEGLMANAIVGPWGSAVMGALEHALAGDPRGVLALKELRNPVNFVRRLGESTPEAWEKLQAGELGRAEQSLVHGLPLKAQKGIALPGYAMTTGDITARRILMRAGFSEDEAKRITLTSTPKEGFFHWASESGKGIPALELAFPFRRTPTNIAQQGLQRIPIVGSFMDQQTPAFQQAISQFALTPAVAGASYLAGSEMDPITAKHARRFVTNAAGQYSLAAGLGFMLGQAKHRGTPLTTFEKAQLMDQAMPLPTSEPVQELFGMLGGKIPRTARPKILEDMGIVGAPETLQQVRTNLPGFRRR